MPWLTGADVTYWGDLDTHGFAILNRLRVAAANPLPADRETLLTHRDRWADEAVPATTGAG